MCNAGGLETSTFEFTTRTGNMVLRSGSVAAAVVVLTAWCGNSVEQEVEWMYAFDIHCNGFVPVFVLLYVVEVSWFQKPALFALHDLTFVRCLGLVPVHHASVPAEWILLGHTDRKHFVPSCCCGLFLPNLPWLHWYVPLGFLSFFTCLLGSPGSRLRHSASVSAPYGGVLVPVWRPWCSLLDDTSSKVVVAWIRAELVSGAVVETATRQQQVGPRKNKTYNKCTNIRDCWRGVRRVTK